MYHHGGRKFLKRVGEKVKNFRQKVKQKEQGQPEESWGGGETREG